MDDCFVDNRFASREREENLVTSDARLSYCFAWWVFPSCSPIAFCVCSFASSKTFDCDLSFYVLSWWKFACVVFGVAWKYKYVVTIIIFRKMASVVRAYECWVVWAGALLSLSVCVSVCHHWVPGAILGREIIYEKSIGLPLLGGTKTKGCITSNTQMVSLSLSLCVWVCPVCVLRSASVCSRCIIIITAVVVVRVWESERLYGLIGTLISSILI